MMLRLLLRFNIKTMPIEMSSSVRVCQICRVKVDVTLEMNAFTSTWNVGMISPRNEVFLSFPHVSCHPSFKHKSHTQTRTQNSTY